MPISRPTHSLLRSLGLISALVAIALLSPPRANADAAQVTVVSPGGAQQTLALEALAGSEDIVNRSYAVRSSSGSTTQVVTGFSLAKVLDAAGADPYAFSYLEVQRPGGGAVRLSRHQALDNGAFPDGPPAVYAAANGTGFLRPSSGDGDDNAADSFVAPQGITISLYKGTPISVVAKASPLKTKPGKTVSFEAIVKGAGAGEKVSYSWYFDDGGSAKTAKAKHSFAKRGSYDVVVGVTTPGNKTGASATVTIQVGEPTSGPDRKGGGTNKNSKAPDHGAADGAGGEGQTTVAPGNGVPLPTPEPYEPYEAPTEMPPPPLEEEVPPPPVVEEPTGDEVRGELLATTGPASAEVTPAEEVAAARSGQLSDDGGGGGGLSGAAVGLLVTAGLLGAGGLIEARNLIR